MIEYPGQKIKIKIYYGINIEFGKKIIYQLFLNKFSIIGIII